MEADVGGLALLGGLLGLQIRKHRLGTGLEYAMSPVRLAAHSGRLHLLLLHVFLELGVVNTAQIGVLEVDFLEGRWEYVHFAAIGQYRGIVEPLHSNLSCHRAVHFDEGLPDFGLFEDENALHVAPLRKQLTELVVSDDRPRFVVDTNQQDRCDALSQSFLHSQTYYKSFKLNGFNRMFNYIGCFSYRGLLLK